MSAIVYTTKMTPGTTRNRRLTAQSERLSETSFILELSAKFAIGLAYRVPCKQGSEPWRLL